MYYNDSALRLESKNAILGGGLFLIFVGGEARRGGSWLRGEYFTCGGFGGNPGVLWILASIEKDDQSLGY